MCYQQSKGITTHRSHLVKALVERKIEEKKMP